MRQVIRYEVQVFFLKSNLGLAVLVPRPQRGWQLALSGSGNPQGVGVQVSCSHWKWQLPPLALLGPRLSPIAKHLRSLILSCLSPLRISENLGAAVLCSMLHLQH